MVSSGTPFPRVVRGIRDRIPQGYILGRLSTGDGHVELIPIPGFVANVVTQQAIGQSVTLNGDVTGPASATTVAKLQGNAVKAGVPTDGQTLIWVNANSDWEPTTKGFVPAGGTTGQVLTKNSNTDFDTKWATPSGGGGGLFASFFIGGADYYVALVNSIADPEMITDGTGTPVYAKNPGFTP